MSRHVLATRTAISPLLAIRIFLNMWCQSKWYRNKEEKQHQDFGIPEVEFVKPGHDEPRKRSQRTQTDPARVLVALPQLAHEGSVEFGKEPQKGSQTNKAAFRGYLNEVVVQMAIEPQVGAVVVLREFIIHTF